MQLTKKDVVSMIGIIKANYTYAYKDVAKDDMLMLIETWYTSLARYEKEVVSVAFQKAVESCSMPPTLADVLKNVKTIQAATEPTEAELWEQLSSTLRKVSGCVYKFQFNAIQANGLTQGENARNEVKAIWQGLPQILQEYCGNESGLINLSKVDDLSFEKGRFIKALPTLKTRIEIRQTVNPDILQLASGVCKELGDTIKLLTLKDTKN